MKLRPPAFPAMPVIAKIQAPQLLANAGLGFTTKPDFNPYWKAIPRFRELAIDEKNRLIKRDPKYGHMVFRCKTVTEGEMVEAIKRGGDFRISNS